MPRDSPGGRLRDSRAKWSPAAGACDNPAPGCEDEVDLKSWMCVICGFVYHEAQGLPEEGIEPGTKWEDVPPNWACPECGARKEDFEMVEV